MILVSKWMFIALQNLDMGYAHYHLFLPLRYVDDLSSDGIALQDSAASVIGIVPRLRKTQR